MADVESVARLRNSAWVKLILKDAETLRLGWLARGVGQALLMVMLIVTAPLSLLRLVSPYQLSQNKFYLDEIYQLLFVAPLAFAARMAFAFDRLIVDGFVNTVGRIPVWTGYLMRALHMGLLQFYAMVTVLAIAVLVVIRMFWAV